jgi:phospholipase C
MGTGRTTRRLALALIVGVGLAFPPSGEAQSSLPGAAAAAKKAKKDKSLPTPNRSGIEHIVVVMMENRSFDHLLGWLPNADGMQEGLTYVDADGIAHPTAPLAPDYMGCAHPDPDHSWQGGRVEYDGAAMDGWLRAGMNDEYAIGYYGEADRPFFNALARHYTTCDRFFAAIMAETYPNRVFQHAAQTDRLQNTLDISTLPTIWDRLAEHEVSAKYYFSDVPFLLLWGTRYAAITRPYAEFLADAAAGTLPSVAFVDPRFINDETGTSGSDHPHADIRVGDAFLEDTFGAVAASPNWSSTVFIVTYDEWGGFFDHVVPPRAVAPNRVDPDVVGGKALLGMRVPVVIASPFTRGDPDDPRVVSTVFDHTSILKLIEWRWNLRPLTLRDGGSDVGNLATALDFGARDPSVPPLPEAEAPLITPCLSALPTADLPLEAIQFISP